MDQHTVHMIIFGTIFIIAYAIIITDKLDRAVVALSGASLMVLTGIISQERAFEEIDFNFQSLFRKCLRRMSAELQHWWEIRQTL